MTATRRDALTAIGTTIAGPQLALGANSPYFFGHHLWAETRIELFAQARGSLVSGVPMTWMAKWVGGHPVYAQSASGARASACSSGRTLRTAQQASVSRWCSVPSGSRAAICSALARITRMSVRGSRAAISR